MIDIYVYLGDVISIGIVLSLIIVRVSN